MTRTDYNELRLLFATQIARLRKEQGLTQEKLAEAIGKTTDYISLLERGKRSPSFEAIVDLADALDISIYHLMKFTRADSRPIVENLVSKPVDPSRVQPVEDTVISHERRDRDLKRLRDAVESLKEMQQLAREYGIRDIFQDNGGKTLQLLILLGLRISPGREGNDAIDADGNEYELKTINIAGRKNPGITTHHHLNPVILEKYRRVNAWYIGIYEDITLIKIYKLSLFLLEPIFQEWERKLQTRESLNNPKIPMKVVKRGEVVYSATV
ncbi:MAG: helix-turn-helix domain-containing protein [Cyanobacteriota bacterium]|nr:helix-turn-helix domain-containing protein [Cyanobacteriota bacterium]